MLIAHSMGTIIAYDILTRLLPEIKIHTLITIGSPLGLPPVMNEFFRAKGGEVSKDMKLPAPEQVTRHWFNFADLEDPIATNFDLADDYSKNSRGVGPVDVIIHNNYRFGGERDPHTLYGYLRAPEVADVIRLFLEERSGLFRFGP